MGNALDTVIDISDLGYRYPRATRDALHSVSFSIGRGEIFGLLGPSGAGKSTTIKTMLGVLRGYSGSIRIEDTELSDLTRSHYAGIGAAFEFPSFYPRLTALENLRFFASLYPEPRRDAMELLERFGLADAAHARYDTFSKGMRMRLNYCRAIIHRPAILFLDESTSGLDPVLAAEIKRSIREERRDGTTVICTTHDMHVADELCDRVAFLADGTIKALDRPRTLKSRYGRRSVLVEYRTDGALEKLEVPLAEIARDARLASLAETDSIETLHSQETTLEQVCFHVTGTELTG
jgi:fluoroquinolone transport system ATP-binding protein